MGKHKTLIAVSTVTLIFLALKLTGVAPMPWGWVFSPVWIPIAESLVMYLINEFTEPRPPKGE